MARTSSDVLVKLSKKIHLIKILICITHVFAHWQNKIRCHKHMRSHQEFATVKRTEKNYRSQIHNRQIPNISLTASGGTSFPISLNLFSARIFSSAGVGNITTAICLEKTKERKKKNLRMTQKPQRSIWK